MNDTRDRITLLKFAQFHKNLAIFWTMYILGWHFLTTMCLMIGQACYWGQKRIRDKAYRGQSVSGPKAYQQISPNAPSRAPFAALTSSRYACNIWFVVAGGRKNPSGHRLALRSTMALQPFSIGSPKADIRFDPCTLWPRSVRTTCFCLTWLVSWGLFHYFTISLFHYYNFHLRNFSSLGGGGVAGWASPQLQLFQDGGWWKTYYFSFPGRHGEHPIPSVFPWGWGWRYHHFLYFSGIRILL